jgi:hypothetical protein
MKKDVGAILQIQLAVQQKTGMEETALIILILSIVSKMVVGDIIQIQVIVLMVLQLRV